MYLLKQHAEKTQLCCPSLPMATIKRSFKRRFYLKTHCQKTFMFTFKRKRSMDINHIHAYLEIIWKLLSWSVVKIQCLLVLESISDHLEDSVKSKRKEWNTHSVIIPGGLTSILQPLNVCLLASHSIITSESYIKNGWHVMNICSQRLEQSKGHHQLKLCVPRMSQPAFLFCLVLLKNVSKKWISLVQWTQGSIYKDDRNTVNDTDNDDISSNPENNYCTGRPRIPYLIV